MTWGRVEGLPGRGVPLLPGDVCSHGVRRQPHTQLVPQVPVRWDRSRQRDSQADKLLQRLSAALRLPWCSGGGGSGSFPAGTGAMWVLRGVWR